MARTNGKWQDRMKNIAHVMRIVTYNCRKMAICNFLLLCALPALACSFDRLYLLVRLSPKKFIQYTSHGIQIYKV